MRRVQTEPEQRLWLELKAKRFNGAKFRRQKVIGRYIVDFSCRTPTMLVIELDGETHVEQVRYDAARSRFLEEQGYHVLRFTNFEVMSNLDGVLVSIQQALQLPLSPALSPEGEREKGW
jgi:very-short-patch-repair endonuclease